MQRDESMWWDVEMKTDRLQRPNFKWNGIIWCHVWDFNFVFSIFCLLLWGGTIWLAVRLVAMLIPLLQRLYWFSISNKRQQSETVGALGPPRRYHFQNNKWSNEIENAFDFYSIPFAQALFPPATYLTDVISFITINKNIALLSRQRKCLCIERTSRIWLCKSEISFL